MSLRTIDFSEQTSFSIFGLFLIIVGFTTGVISQTTITRNQLKRLSREYKFGQNKKEIILLVVPGTIFLVLVLFFFWLQIPPLFSIASVFAWISRMWIIRFALFYAYEKKENMRLVQSWWGTEIYVIPKAPNSRNPN